MNQWSLPKYFLITRHINSVPLLSSIMPQVEFYLNSQLPSLHLEESSSNLTSVAVKSSTRDEAMALGPHRKRPSDESFAVSDKSQSSVIDKSTSSNSTWASPEACRSVTGDSITSCPVRLFSGIMILPRSILYLYLVPFIHPLKQLCGLK